jgi:hypothetical protein
MADQRQNILIFGVLFYLKVPVSQALWHAPIIPAMGKLRQKAGEFQASLGSIARPFIKK